MLQRSREQLGRWSKSRKNARYQFWLGRWQSGYRDSGYVLPVLQRSREQLGYRPESRKNVRAKTNELEALGTTAENNERVLTVGRRVRAYSLADCLDFTEINQARASRQRLEVAADFRYDNAGSSWNPGFLEVCVWPGPKLPDTTKGGRRRSLPLHFDWRLPVEHLSESQVHPGPGRRQSATRTTRPVSLSPAAGESPVPCLPRFRAVSSQVRCSAC
jgi:hypothetical protein